MPLPIIPVPKFPNIPPFPGVPPILRNANAAVTNVITGLNSAKALVQRVLGITPAVQWGVFTSEGRPAIVGLSVIAFEYAKDTRISDFPIEKGSFASYNKVDVPADAKITFSAGDTETTRNDFLMRIEPQLKTLDLFTVVTPDKSYTNMNVVHYDYRRTAESGAGLLIVDVWLREVREAPDAEFTATQEATGESTQDSGPVQATTVPPVVATERALEASGAVRP